VSTIATSVPQAGPTQNALRVFFVGGYYSFRALFAWISPWLYIPILLVGPVFEILFFAFLGRASGVGSDTFFVVGNTLLSVSVATFFGGGFLIDGERQSQTLGAIVATPANRVALFVGRSLPVMVNGIFVALWGFGIANLLLDVHVPLHVMPAFVLALAAAAFSAAGAGFVLGAVGLRFRDAGLAANMAYALLLVFSGANVPRADLPHWMRVVGDGLPITHALAAARELVRGGTLASAGPKLMAEAAIGVAYGLVGYAMLRLLELQGRRSAALELL
jgi:ABC-2 type transport system permease protein